MVVITTGLWAGETGMVVGVSLGCWLVVQPTCAKAMRLCLYPHEIRPL